MRSMSCLALLGGVFLLAGCSGTSEVMGLGRHSPDEFAVVDRAPLSLPPDYELRPPNPGAPRPQEVETTDRASHILFGKRQDNAAVEGDISPVEKALLGAAGADKADPTIRATIDREAKQHVVGSQNLVDELLWWRDPADNATTVDAPAEANRLRKAKKDAEPVNKKPTPIIEKNRSGWLF